MNQRLRRADGGLHPSKSPDRHCYGPRGVIEKRKRQFKYHVVFIPKCRRRTLYEQLRRDLGEVFRTLAVHKESWIEEGHLMLDRVHMLIAIPPKYAVSQVIGYIKGKSAQASLRPCSRTHVLSVCDEGSLAELERPNICAKSQHLGFPTRPLR